MQLPRKLLSVLALLVVAILVTGCTANQQLTSYADSLHSLDETIYTSLLQSDARSGADPAIVDAHKTMIARAEAVYAATKSPTTAP